MAQLRSTVLIMAVEWAICSTALAQKPDADRSAPPLGYAVSGVVRDARHQPVRGARVEVLAPGFEGQFVLSDGNGRYRIRDLSGGVLLHASRDGYFSNVVAVAAAGDAIADLILQPVRRIAIGEAVRDVLTPDYPTCVGHANDGPESRAVVCHRLLVTPLAEGTLDVIVTWDRSLSLAVDVIASDGQALQSGAGAGRTHLTIPVDKGSTYEVRVRGDRRKLGAQQEFGVVTTLR